MKLRLLSLTALFALGLTSFADDSVKLLLPSKRLAATSTFELRFATPMVPPDQIGKAAPTSPVVLRPSVKTHFTWTSDRSGVLAPDEALPLATTFELRLAPALSRADGTPFTADFRETIATPSMEPTGWTRIFHGNGQESEPMPRVSILFNVDVDPVSAAGFLKFVNQTGETIGSVVSRANQDAVHNITFSGSGIHERTMETWAERFANTRAGTTPEPARLRNFITVTPAQPLPPGENWKLLLQPGLHSDDGRLSVVTASEFPIGTIRPFEIRRVTANNDLNSPRHIMVDFSKDLAADITPANLARWMRVTPCPRGFITTVFPQSIRFDGEFETGTKYTIEADAGLPARPAFVLAGRFERTVEFEPIPPRIYFEEFATHQQAHGSRKFHVMAVNVPQIRISAKLFSSDTAAPALEAYQHYLEITPSSRESGDSFTKVADDQIPGQTIWHREIPGTNATDEAQTFTLDWDEILGGRKHGAVLLTAEEVGTGKRPGAQAFVQLTDLGVVMKSSAGEQFVHVFSLASAKPAAGARVRILDEKSEVMQEAITDAGGIAQLPRAQESRWLLIESGDDRHLIDLASGPDAITARSLHSGERFSGDEDDETIDRPAFLFTDRPVYKPGETLHLKGIVRDRRNGHTGIPAGTEVWLTGIDARGRTFFTKSVRLSDSGALSEDIKLPDATLGTYRVTLAYSAEKNDDAGPVAEHEFEVQEYRTNAFEISVGAPPNPIGTTEFSIPVTAKYYMGKPLSRAQLTWSIEASDEDFRPAGFDDFHFCDGITSYRLSRLLDRTGHFSQNGRADLDDGGLASIAATIPINLKAPQPRTARVQCEITDLNQQTVSTADAITIHASDFYLGLRQPPSLVREGEALPTDVIAVRPDGTPFPETVNVTLRLTRIDWQTLRVVGAGNSDEFRNTPHFVLEGAATTKTRALSKADGKWMLANPDAETARLAVGKPGDYLLEAIAKDASGREVQTTMNFEVVGANATTWDYRNAYEIELVPDQEEYRTGQVATLLVKTPIAGEALVTIERERVLRSFVTRLHGNAPSVQIPLEEMDAPNVFVSVTMLRGSEQSPLKVPRPEFRVGFCKLAVVRPDAHLFVSVDPETKAYRPGETVRLTADVKNFSGQPVPDAEVTLYAVDEGVLSLMGYETPDPYSFFNTERALRVETSLTLRSLLNEEDEERGFPNKGYLIGDGGGDRDSLRKNFLACAFWNGALRTDHTGRVRAEFPAPDSLTRYRVIAIVHTARDQFGHAESAFEINKPLMLEPAMPRFANVGDQLFVRAVLHNATDFAGEAEVVLELDDKARTEAKTRRVSLAARASVAVDFPVAFEHVGTAVWKWSANLVSADVATAFRDSVQTELKVGFPAPLLREVRTGTTDAAEVALLDTIDPQLLDGSGTVRVSVSNSRLLDLRESLHQLLHYPYGCVEQTTSSTLPWITLRDLREALPDLNKSDEAIANAVNAGVNRLLKMQTSSGGLAYWPGGPEPLFWGSAYGGFGLALARQKGFAVPQEEFDLLMNYLSRELRSGAPESVDQHYHGGGPTDQVLAVYALALAGRGEPAYHEMLFKKRAELSRENRCLLALAIAESGGDPQMIAELTAASAEVADSDSHFGSRDRALAVRLLALGRTQPNSPDIEPLAAELLRSRRGGHWVTTQGNIWSLLAISDYARRTEAQTRAISGTFAWGAQSGAFDLGRKPQMIEKTFPLVAKGAAEPFRLLNPERGRLFTEVTVEARPKLITQPQQDRGYFIRRTYRKIADDGSVSELQEARVGDRILVELEIEARAQATYVAVDDPLPAIFEAVNPAFKTQNMIGGEQTRDWLSDHRELREDRVLFFADHLSPGTYRIRYLARVCAAGTATAPAAKIEEMYHPERCGITATAQLVSLPLK